MSSSDSIRAASRAFTRAAGGSPEKAATRFVRVRPDSLTFTRVTLWLVCAAIFIVPIAAVVAVGASSNSLPTLLGSGIVRAGVNSLVSAGVSAILAVALGTALALLLDRTDLPGRGALRLIMLSPMLVPPFVGAIAWIGVAGPQSAANLAWASMFGGPLWNIYGGDGVIFLLTVHSYPIAYLIVGATLRRVPADLEQAARISGATPWRAIRQVTVPLLSSAMLSAFTLTIVSNLADFGIPSIIGTPERYETLSTLVYRYIQSGTVDDPLAVVSTIGTVLLIVALIAVALEHLVSRRGWELEPSATPWLPLRLGGARWPIASVAWLLGLALTVLPLLALASQALLPAPGVPLTLENLTLNNVIAAVSAPATSTAAINSVVLSVSAGVLCGVLGLVIGTVSTRTRARSNVLLRAVAMLPQAIPGLVLAVGWLLIAPALGIFNTPWLILCAYVMAFTALVVQAVSAPLRSIPLALEEAARVSGASRMRSILDISLRLAVPAAVTGSILVVLTAVRELTISVLLVAPGTQTLGVTIFNLQQAGAYNAASALSLIITVVGLTGLGLAARQVTGDGPTSSRR